MNGRERIGPNPTGSSIKVVRNGSAPETKLHGFSAHSLYRVGSVLGVGGDVFKRMVF